MHDLSITFQHRPDAPWLGTRAQVRASRQNDQRSAPARVLLVLDRSGSMAGSCYGGQDLWHEVQQAVIGVLDQGLKCDVVTYNDSVKELSDPRGIYNLSAQCMTNFAAAFDYVKTYSNTHVNVPVVVVFLTDGCHTSSVKEAPARQRLQLAISMRQAPITIHAIGFGAQHDFSLLEKIRLVGTSPGLFQYYNQSTARGDVSQSNTACSILMEMASFAASAVQATVSIGALQVPCDFETDDDHSTTTSATFWIPSQVAAQVLAGELTVDVSTMNHTCVRVQRCEEQRCVDMHFELDALDYQADSTATAADAERLQRAVTSLQVPRGSCDTRISREARAEWDDKRRQLQAKLDEFHATLASAARSQLNSVDTIARLRSLQFSGRLSKARRQRAMDRRTTANTRSLMGLDARLKTLAEGYVSCDDADLQREQAQWEAQQRDLTCMFSTDSVANVLDETSDNFLGFGIVIERPEHAIDDPTMVRVLSVSSTILSWASFQDAAAYHQRCGGVRVAGGFSRADGGSKAGASVHAPTTVLEGMAKEPINAILPVYACAKHQERVEALLPLLCGSLFTLNESAYDRRQVSALFSVLAQVHALVRVASNDRARFFAEQFTRVCATIDLASASVCRALGLSGDEQKLCEAFEAQASARSKASLPSLHTLAGHMIVRAWRERNVCTWEHVGDWLLDQPRLACAFAAELLRRRASALMYRWATSQGSSNTASPPKPFQQQLRQLVYGTSTAATVSAPLTVSRELELAPRDDWLAWAYTDPPFAPECTPRVTPTSFVEYTSRPVAGMDDVDDSQALALLCEALGVAPGTSLAGAVHMPFRAPIELCLGATTAEGTARAVAVQALCGSSNSDYATLLDVGMALDDARDGSQQQRLLAHLATGLDQPRRSRWNTATAVRAADDVAHVLLYEVEGLERDMTQQVYFAALCNALLPTRGGLLWTRLVEALFDDGAAAAELSAEYRCVPSAAQKMVALVSGVLLQHEKMLPVTAKGEAWAPGKVVAELVKERVGRVLGDRPLAQLLCEYMDGKTVCHVYRLSGIPNRHGHSNENPFLGLASRWDA